MVNYSDAAELAAHLGERRMSQDGKEQEQEELKPLTTGEVLRKETEELWGEKAESNARLHPDDVLTTDDLLAAEREELGNPGPNLAALCLSGGGIRSAAFALGVVQA